MGLKSENYGVRLRGDTEPKRRPGRKEAKINTKKEKRYG